MTKDTCGAFNPFGFQDGKVTMQTDEVKKIKENLIHLLMTGLGERVMRRNYGGGLRQFVHEPNNDALRALAQHQVATAILQWEPRVRLRKLNVYQQDGTLLIELTYSLENDGQVQTLSIPIQR